MAEEDGNAGTFKHKLVGVTPRELEVAGVHNTDSDHIANWKVINHRQRQGTPVAGEPMSLLAWKILIFALALFGIVFSSAFIADVMVFKFDLSPRYVDVISKVELVGSPYIQMGREFSLKHMSQAKVFREGAPVSGIFLTCGPGCFSPGLKSFDQFRQYARSTSNYESGLCGYFLLQSGDWKDSIELPQFTLDRKKKQCAITNPDQVAHNLTIYNLRFFVPIILAALLCFWLLVFLFRLKDTSK